MIARSFRLAVLLVACLLAAARCHCGSVDFKNPVRSAAEDEIKDLPNLSERLNFRQYSGYVEADDQKPTNRFWHYWFVESQSDPANDPLVLWLNGGPGCSSLLGLLTELGPIRVAANNTVVQNPYAWNKRANVVFLESPAGVGFSYAVDGDVKADDDTTAKQNHLALRNFLKKFPQYRKNPLYLTGESYGGVYLPTLGSLVDDDAELNLKGIAIGNGYLDANKLAESLVYFSYYHGLVGQSTWKGLSKSCCGGKPPARGQCKFTDATRSEECGHYVQDATDSILGSGINPYNLYDKCAQSDGPRALHERFASVRGREHFDRQMVLSAFNLTSARRGQKLATRSAIGRELGHRRPVRNVGGDPPCTDDSIVINYLNQPEARRALHIPDALKTEFTTCFDQIAYTMIYPGQPGGLAPQMNKLINSKRDLTLLVYNGDIDLMCNFFGDEWFVDDLGRKVVRDYEPWHTHGQVSGWIKYFDGITFATVKGSGHMVPTDRPAEALHMFDMFLDGMKPYRNSV